MKEIIKIVKAAPINMGGHLLDQPLPIEGLVQIDPFLLIHHWKNNLPGNQSEGEVGVGPHPHRGFSPVTFVFKGIVEHRDSLGNFASVGEGGTQWMFAGRGITHSERFGKKLAKQGGEIEFIQFWVNAPSFSKMDAPYYKPIQLEDTPLIEKENVKIWLITGEIEDKKGIVNTYSPQLLVRAAFETDGVYNFELPLDFNALIYVLDGNLTVNGKQVGEKEMAVFSQNGTNISVLANQQTRFILLSGEPINEPINSYGPFVMNTQSEVMQAVKDAQMGKMGVLIEDFSGD